MEIKLKIGSGTKNLVRTHVLGEAKERNALKGKFWCNPSTGLWNYDWRLKATVGNNALDLTTWEHLVKFSTLSFSISLERETSIVCFRQKRKQRTIPQKEKSKPYKCPQNEGVLGHTCMSNLWSGDVLSWISGLLYQRGVVHGGFR